MDEPVKPFGEGKKGVQNGFLLGQILGKPLMEMPAFLRMAGRADEVDGGIFRGKAGRFDIKKKDIFRASQIGMNDFLKL